MRDFLAQLPSLVPGEVERWIASAVAVGGALLLWMRLTGRRPGQEFVTRQEFREELSTIRDRIDSRHLALIETIEKLQASLQRLSHEGETRDAALHRRLGDLEAGLARLDERTKRS